MAEPELHEDDREPAHDVIPEEYEYDDDDDIDDEVLVLDGVPSPRAVPTHPVPSMQGPFEESILESERPDANATNSTTPKLGAKARHERLLSNSSYNESYNAKWRAQPSSKWHPLSKILAQIVFGIHLLHQQLAKSDEEVVKILQRHVDEVDNFIQYTGEDFELALADIQERINYLKLPLEHVNIFDIMLDDRQFRNQIIDGNEKIEHIVGRTAQLMNDLLTDVHKGVEATAEMALYLDKVADDWPDDEGSLTIFNTMQANAEGWIDCFKNLQIQGNSLGVVLVQLGSILNEMTKRAGVASRRSVVPRPPSASSAARHQSRSGPTSRYTQTKQSKPLPEDPDLVARAVAATLPNGQPLSNQHPIPFEERWERPRSQPDPRRQCKTPKQESREPPPLAESKKRALNPETAALTTFLRDTGPDRSRTPQHPQSLQTPRRVGIQENPNTPPPESAPDTPTSKPKRIRSKLRRKGKDIGKSKDKDSIIAQANDASKSPSIQGTSYAGTRTASPSAPDSAYSSGSNSADPSKDASSTSTTATTTTNSSGTARPTRSSIPPPLTLTATSTPLAASTPALTSPTRVPSAGKLSLFPSAANSVVGSAFPSELSLALGSSSGSRPATSRAPHALQQQAGDAPPRRGSVPSGAGDALGSRVRRKASLLGLRRWLSGGWRERDRERERREDTPVARKMVGVGESLDVVPEAY